MRANADITCEIERTLRTHADEIDPSLDPANGCKGKSSAPANS